MENSKKKMLREVSNDHLTPKKRDDLVQSEIFGDFEEDDLEYPWFAPKMQVFESGGVQDMCGEDVSFCLDAKEAGIETWCDPRIRVGHEKTRVI